MSQLKTKRLLARSARCGSRKAELSVITLSNENELLSISPFQAETSHTHYCDGFLLVVSPSWTISEIKALVSRFPRIDELIDTPQYRQNQVGCGDRCCLYQISNIDWGHFCFTPESEVVLVAG